MYDSMCEYLREVSIRHLFNNIASFSRSWQTWKQAMSGYIGDSKTANNIINLGDRLRDIFLQTGTSGRSQSSLSAGGSAWEALVCWYLNLCLIGSRTIIIKQNQKFIPEPIKNAITVTYANFPSNTESDLVGITFPNFDEYKINKVTLDISDASGNNIPTLKRGKFNYKEIVNALCERHFTEYEIGIIQCKTNWNDNAQIPMLWDMTYDSSGFRTRNINVGISNYSIRDVRNFSYSFVTVPTSRGPFTPNSLCVKRVQNISGGNYWGQSSIPSVAFSIKEIFGRNFANGAETNLRTNLGNALQHLDTNFDYFDI